MTDITPQSPESFVPQTFDTLHEEFKKHTNRYPGDTIDQLLSLCNSVPSLKIDAIKEQIKCFMLEFLRKQEDILCKYNGQKSSQGYLYANRKHYRNKVRKVIKDVVVAVPQDSTLTDVVQQTIQTLQVEMNREY